jgi:hypothetical protein
MVYLYNSVIRKNKEDLYKVATFTVQWKQENCRIAYNHTLK